MERIGLVGLPNAGKSALFNALTGASTPVAPHPFTTTESAVGVAHVPDERLIKLAAMSESKKTVFAGVEVVDIGGLVASSERDGLGNRMLAGIREVDAICLVVRSFEDENVVGETDPVTALESLELELGVEIVDERLVTAAHECGVALHVWTVDDPLDMERLIELGVDGVMTDRPSVLAALLERRGVTSRTGRG